MSTKSNKASTNSPVDMQKRIELLTTIKNIVSQLDGTQVEKAKAMDITQPRLNDLLKGRIEKFSLDALVAIATKLGLRVSVNTQQVTGLGSIDPRMKHNASVFAPAPQELGKLDSTQGTMVFLSLLRCEATSNGLSSKDVVLSYRVNSKDGGIDAKVIDTPTSIAFLQKGDTYYQIKTGSSFKPWQPSSLKTELFGKSTTTVNKSNLADEVRSCLDQGGSYVIVTFGHDLLPNEHSKSIIEVKKLLKNCGYENPKIAVYGQGQLIGELDKYPSLCLDLIGLSDGGFESHLGWKSNAQMQLPIELGDKQVQLIDDIRNSLDENAVKHIRLIGEPGIGKTRLALEALSTDQFPASVVYVRTGEEFQSSALFNELLKPDRTYSIILVIDDCDNDDRSSIWNALKGRDGIKLLTLDHGPDNTYDSTMRTFDCPKLENEQIEQILYGYLQKKSDLHNWASWCDGSPRVAHAVGENLRSNPEDILKTPADVPIWDRFIIGHKKRDSREAEQYRVVLRHIALFQKFGFEHPVGDEAKFISSNVNEVDPEITWGRFQKIVQDLRDRRILQGRHTLFIIPKALQIYLWIDYWNCYGRDFDFPKFLEKMPTSLKHWFLKLFIYAESAGPAKNVVKEILSSSGPFADRNFLESETGMRFLNYLSEADPNSTLSLLERTIKTWKQDEILSWKNGRQDVVWALEKIACWDNLFLRAADVLIPMALAENAGNSNNSKGLLISLFRIGIGWASTQASPKRRFPVLERLVTSTDSAEKELGFELCKEWINTHGRSRIVGAEYQGMKPAIEFWSPDTYGEIYDSWRLVLELLRREMPGLNIIDRNKAAEVVAQSARGLIHNVNIAEEVLEILFYMASDDDINKKSITAFVIWELNHKAEELEPAVLKKIEQLDKRLTGESLWGRTLRYIINTNWDEDHSYRKGEIEEKDAPSKRVKQLAREYAVDSLAILDQLPKLLRHDGLRLLEFGREYGSLANNDVDKVIFTAACYGDSEINGQFLGGYLAGIRIQDQKRWENALTKMLSDDRSSELAVQCIWGCGYNENILKKMLALFVERKLNSYSFHAIAYRGNNKEISSALFEQIINALLEHPDETTVRVCIRLIQCYYFEKDSSLSFPKDLIFSVLTSESESEEERNIDGYAWHMIANSYLDKFPNDGLALLNWILTKNGDLHRYNNANYFSQVADRIIEDSPGESWKIISNILESNDISSWRVSSWLGDSGFDEKAVTGAIQYIVPSDVVSWINDNIQDRLYLIRHALPKTLDIENGGELTRLVIETYDLEDFGNSLYVHFHMGGWSGNESTYLSKKRDSARLWLSEQTSQKLQAWLSGYIDYLSVRIESSEIREERQF